MNLNICGVPLTIVNESDTEWRRRIGWLIFKDHFPQFQGHFPQKSPPISGSCAENNLQLKTSYSLRHPVQPVPDKMRHEMVIGMQVAILDGQSPGLLTNEPFEKRPVMP